MTSGDNIATGIFKRGVTSKVDACSDADTIGVARSKNDDDCIFPGALLDSICARRLTNPGGTSDDVTDQPSSGPHVHDSDHTEGGDIAGDGDAVGGGNAVGGDIDPGATAFPPPSQPSDYWSTFVMVLDGFDGDHEMTYWGFVQQRHLNSTTMFLMMRFLIFPFYLVTLLKNGSFLKACLYMFLWGAPFMHCLWLCHKKRFDQLGFGIMLMGVGRTISYLLPMLGFPEFLTPSFQNKVFIPIETLALPFFEPAPIRLYAPLHHAIWSAGLLRAEYHDTSILLNPYIILLGYCTALAIRVRIDMHDRRAYVRKVATWHANRE